MAKDKGATKGKGKSGGAGQKNKGKGGKGGGKGDAKGKAKDKNLTKKQARKSIHPEYVDSKITCGCGNVIETRSTKASMTVAVCSKCHPFYSGQQRFVDTAGRVERFQRKYGWVEGKTPKEVAKTRKEKLARAKADLGAPGEENAQLRGAKAQLETAQLNLEFTKPKFPR